MSKCKYCDGQGSWFGLAPHRHNLKKTGSIIGSTEIKDKSEWPDNFTEVEPGTGVYKCEECKGTGEVQ